MEAPSTQQKALRINLDLERFGTFAEIGAGQEVARWFFHVGRAAGTVAKSISAYDTAVSDGLYGPTDHYVSRHRLEAMLDHEYSELLERLNEKRGQQTAFFVFGETAATHIRPNQAGGHAWMGIRFQSQPRSEPSEVIIHVQLRDTLTASEQESLGLLGVNLIYAALYHSNHPNTLIHGLMDGLSRRRIEVDTIKFSGPAFADVDNRLMSLQLVEGSLTDTVMFTVDGEVVQPSEVLSGRPVLLERGNFRPVTNVMLAMLRGALGQFRHVPGMDGEEPVVVMEMTLNNLMTDRAVDHQDFLARVDMLRPLGNMAMVSSYTRFDLISRYLRTYTRKPIALVVGLPTLREMLDEKYYADLAGGLIEGLGQLFCGAVKLYVYPMKDTDGKGVTTAETLQVEPALRHLYAHLLENKLLEPIRDYSEEQLQIRPGAVLEKIRAGDPAWEKMVPAPAAAAIKKHRLFTR